MIYEKWMFRFLNNFWHKIIVLIRVMLIVWAHINWQNIHCHCTKPVYGYFYVICEVLFNCYHVFFSNAKFTGKRWWRNSNSDLRSRRRARWPLDHCPRPLVNIVWMTCNRFSIVLNEQSVMPQPGTNTIKPFWP